MNESEIGELERLSSFLRERLVVVPSGEKDLVEYLRTFNLDPRGQTPFDPRKHRLK